MSDYTIDEARQAAADLEREVAALRLRDRDTGRFTAGTDPEVALRQGGVGSLDEALVKLRQGQRDGLRRLGLAMPTSSSTSSTSKASGDFGGGNRGREIVPAGPDMNDALKALLRARGGY
jgi:hypothetical protein